jgi:hypothetical protein
MHRHPSHRALQKHVLTGRSAWPASGPRGTAAAAGAVTACQAAPYHRILLRRCSPKLRFNLPAGLRIMFLLLSPICAPGPSLPGTGVCIPGGIAEDAIAVMRLPFRDARQHPDPSMALDKMGPITTSPVGDSCDVWSRKQAPGRTWLAGLSLQVLIPWTLQLPALAPDSLRQTKQPSRWYPYDGAVSPPALLT